MSEKIRVLAWKIRLYDNRRKRVYRPAIHGGFLMVPFNAGGFRVLQEDMAEGEPGDVYEVKFVEMTEKELGELPEHEGW